jgi:hypothetical protein
MSFVHRGIITSTIFLIFWGTGLYAQRTTGVVRQVDHVLVECKDPEKLFSFFADTLRLPVAWSISRNQNYITGGIGTGNVNIEFFAYGGTNAPTTTRYYGIAFEPYPLADALRRLQSLSVPFDKPAPVVSALPNGSSGVAWTTVGLPSLSKPGMSIFLYEYSPSFLKVEVRRKQMGNRLMLNHGGPLEIQSIREIIIGSAALKNDLAAWTLALGKLTASGNISPISGPTIRIEKDSRDQIREIVFKVESITRAKAFLSKNKLLGHISNQKIYLAPSKLQGLQLSLTDK